MDFLKWVLKTSLVLALMFLGLKADPQKDNSDDQSNNQGVAISRVV
jgi:hypothetical protein